MPDHSSLPDNIRISAQILWDYMHVNQPLEKCDIAVAMGSHDLRTAAYAAQLVMDGWANLLVCAGASGRHTNGIWRNSEASLFAEKAMQTGLSSEKILLEENSTNTSENLEFTAQILEKHTIPYQSALLVHKSYMERRVLATAGKVWPHVQVVITSPPIPFLDYATPTIPIVQVINIMVGDFQRIMEYPKKGYALEQEIPEKVISAFEMLVSKGFDAQLI